MIRVFRFINIKSKSLSFLTPRGVKPNRLRSAFFVVNTLKPDPGLPFMG